MTAQILELNGAALVANDDRTEPAAAAAARRTEHTRSHGLALRLSGIGKRYGERQVLEGIDLDIAPGEFVAIVDRKSVV
jgi:sulfonate transport system ATP-binding protein